MKHLTKQLALLLAAVLCLCLTACSGRNEPGSDWRTTGIVRDFGTITRGGKSTKVAVCVHKAEANFYYDTTMWTTPLPLRATHGRCFKASTLPI